ncbi:MAG: SGNH/GDSL hydrolase family protein [Gemmatimonadetes bacterium]|nr:SGNH/GDSL hydrolase family protein [Gemmatimonadota bacterium]
MTTGATPRVRALAGPLLLMATSLCVTLLLVEGALQLLYVPPPQAMAGPQLSAAGFYVRDSVLGWVPRANVSGEHTERGLFTSTFRTNSRGIRGREHALAKPAGTRRIVVIGDSFTWGYGVSNGETYADRLEALLPGTEVINLGVTAYGLRQEIGYLEREGLLYAPDVVVVGLCLNDIYRPELAQPSGTPSYLRAPVPFTASSAPADSTAAAPPTSPFLAVKRFLGTRSHLYRFVIDRVNGNRQLARTLVRLGIKGTPRGFEAMDPNLMPALRTYPPALAASWDATLAELRELQQLSRARGFRLVLALVPGLQTVVEPALEASLAYSVFDPDDFDPDKPYRELEAFGRATGIEVVNPMGRFREATRAGDAVYHRNEMHFNAAGHALFAQAIAERLR